MGFCLRTVASNFMRSASAAAVTRMRLASASERFFWRSTSALLSMIFACAAASAFCRVASLRALASSLVCLICFWFRGRGYFMGSGFGFGWEPPDLRLSFRLLHVTGLLGIGFQFGNLHFFELDVLLGAETFVF